MALTPKTKQFLKAKAHSLKPVVQIGQHGLTEAVHKAINEALRTHELIKIHIAGVDREAKRAMVARICQINKAEQVSIIGNVGIIYRKNVKKKRS